jgi:ElaB/YqjD/DUF883 family membrane-anchored ribosome-binding protein
VECEPLIDRRRRRASLAMTTTSSRINEDIAVLRGDLHRLAADFAALPDRLRSYRRKKIMRSRERVRNTVTGLENRAKDRLRDTSYALKDRGYGAVDRCRGEVEHRPLASIAVAFVAGWLLAFVMEHTCRRHH